MTKKQEHVTLYKVTWILAVRGQVLHYALLLFVVFLTTYHGITPQGKSISVD